MSENEAYAMVFIRNNKKITNGDCQKINNVNRDKALGELKGLMAKKLIKPQGVGSGTYYILSDVVEGIIQISFNDLNVSSNIEVNTDIIPINTDIIIENAESLNKNERLVLLTGKFTDYQQRSKNYYRSKEGSR